MKRVVAGLLLSVVVGLASTEPPVMHFTMERRGGDFPTHSIANMTFLAAELETAEARFNLTRREMRGNKVVRRPKERGVGGGDSSMLMGDVGRNGNWFAKLKLGTPEQTVQMDLDMLTSDFFLFTTTSNKGSQFYDFSSQSYRKTNQHPFPTCQLPTETVHLPTVGVSIPVSVAHCRPPKSSLDTLLASGSMLGLAPSDSLGQIRTPSLLHQLAESQAIEHSVWSLMLINGQDGIFSVGGTAAEAVKLVEQQTKEELDRVGELETAKTLSIMSAESPPAIVRRTEHRGEKGVKTRGRGWDEAWIWSRVQGANGWWQILMQGVWVDGSKVLKNQPVILDVNTPFVLAPPLAAKAFYASISGARPMAPPYDQFYAFPCLNPPKLAFEFGGWPFPAMQGGKGTGYWSLPGGKFSLGKIGVGSGYCVGAVVETRMGAADVQAAGVGRRGSRGPASAAGTMDAGNGLRDVWVLGEVFFRGVSGVFDFKDMKVGLRSY